MLLDCRVPLCARRAAVCALRTSRRVVPTIAPWCAPARRLAEGEVETSVVSMLVDFAAQDPTDPFLAALSDSKDFAKIWLRYYKNRVLTDVAVHLTHDAGAATLLLYAIAIAEALLRDAYGT
jgi:hypothetical protein